MDGVPSHASTRAGSVPCSMQAGPASRMMRCAGCVVATRSRDGNSPSVAIRISLYICPLPTGQNRLIHPPGLALYQIKSSETTERHCAAKDTGSVGPPESWPETPGGTWRSAGRLLLYCTTRVYPPPRRAGLAKLLVDAGHRRRCPWSRYRRAPARWRRGRLSRQGSCRRARAEGSGGRSWPWPSATLD
jgi:hypothetical protein